VFSERSADAATMTANEVDLKLADLVGGDADLGKLAEAGVDAVDGLGMRARASAARATGAGSNTAA
jgi:hypothetical protein